jgi:hypothetical protein
LCNSFADTFAASGNDSRAPLKTQLHGPKYKSIFSALCIISPACNLTEQIPARDSPALA